MVVEKYLPRRVSTRWCLFLWPCFGLQEVEADESNDYPNLQLLKDAETSRTCGNL